MQYENEIKIRTSTDKILTISCTSDAAAMQAVFTVLPVRFAKAVAALVRPRKDGGLQGDQLFDLLCVFIFAATLSFLRLLPAGTIYFWLKDLTQEFLKLHVVHSAVEIFDKVTMDRQLAGCDFGVRNSHRGTHNTVGQGMLVGLKSVSCLSTHWGVMKDISG